ncbi:unnamed protein product [Amaranthus hypochondriacus]
MESLNTAALMEDFLDFSEEDDDETPQTSTNHHRTFSLLRSHSFPEFVEEEELEWISNKDTFPMVESLVDFMPSTITDNYNGISISNSTNSNSTSHLSPISVLENSSGGFNGNVSHGRSFNNGNMMMINFPCNFKVPGKARSKHGRKRRDMLGPQFQHWPVHDKVVKKPGAVKFSSVIGRKCLHCGAEKTPQWRAGPKGPKTLCNACGVRYKSGRLCDEYRPASSPTFSPEIHSNSHRKIVEMWKKKTNNGSRLNPANAG